MGIQNDCTMTTSHSDPLATQGFPTITVESFQKSAPMPPYCLKSPSDSNENVVESPDLNEKSVERTKKYDFLVWHHPCNQVEAAKVYERMEAKGLRGYIFERDKIAGQYKLVAMEGAIRDTANIILLLSREALQCKEFERKMHSTITTAENSVIPIYIGIRKADGPRLLRHHVDVQYKDDNDFWERMECSITRPKKTNDMPFEAKFAPRDDKKELPSNLISVSKQDRKPIKVVPVRVHHVVPSLPPSSKKSGIGKFLSFFRSKKDVSNEPPSIQLKTMRTKRTGPSPE